MATKMAGKLLQMPIIHLLFTPDSNFGAYLLHTCFENQGTHFVMQNIAKIVSNMASKYL